MENIDYKNINRRIIRNSGFLLAPQVINFVLHSFFTLVQARYLGVVNFGMFYLSLALIQLCYSLADMGICMIITRDLAKSGDKELDRYLYSSLTSRILIVIVIYGAICLFTTMSDYLHSIKGPIYILAIGVGLSSIVQVYIAVFRGFEKMKYEALGLVIFNTINTTLGITLLLCDFGIISLSISHLMANLFFLLYISFMFGKVFNKKFFIIQLNIKFLKYIFKSGLALGLSKVFKLMESKIDVLILALFSSPVEIGWYSAARRICDILIVFPSIINISIFPVLSNLFTSNRASLHYATSMTSRLLIFVSFPIALFCTIVPDKIVVLFFGAPFLPSGKILMIIIWLIVISYFGAIPGTLMISTNKQNIFTLLLACQLSITSVLSFVLVPHLGAAGTAVSVVTSHGICTLAAYLIVAKHFSSSSMLITNSITITAGLMMGMTVFFVKDYNFFIATFVGMVSYFLYYYLLRLTQK